jgi:inhibitor of KinA
LNNCDNAQRDISDLIEIRTASDCSVILYVNDAKLGLDKSNALIGLLTKELLSNRPTWLREYIPSYTSLLIEYSLFDTDHLAVNRYLRHLINSSLSHIGTLLEDVMDENKQSDTQGESSTLHKIPVCYELSSFESDLKKVASEKALTIEELIAMHCAVCYRVFATGFLPGFAYLGELPEELSQARLNNPRSKVQKGAVAIADRQTAIYPDESPGGWHILGYTPIDLLSHSNQQKSNEVTPLLKAGDYVEFFPITEQQYLNWRSE